ncbi:MAG TPA: DUF3341 domain-containing protein [Steroidobacteraceae bacterium]|jgi:hypothetical protein
MAALLATFASEADLKTALERFPAEKWPELEIYSPLPLSSEPKHSPLPALMFAAGMLGFIGFFLLMTYADTQAYPHNIGGRPAFAWPAFIPIAFELGVLCAMVAGFVGYFVVCRLPKLYDEVDEFDGARRGLYDRWLLCVRIEEAKGLSEAHAIFRTLHPESLEERA